MLPVSIICVHTYETKEPSIMAPLVYDRTQEYRVTYKRQADGLGTLAELHSEAKNEFAEEKSQFDLTQ